MVSDTPGTRTQISGYQSSGLTHSLRALHDAILVGIGTVLADDPRLSTRLDKVTRNIVNDALEKHTRVLKYPDACPTAVVLDSHLRTPPSAKFLSQPHCADATRRPLVFTRKSEATNPNYIPLDNQADIVPVDTDNAGQGTMLNLVSVVDHLNQMGVNSVMVEGGPSVLTSFIAAGLCDLLIITLAPVIFGKGVSFAGNQSVAQSSITRLHQPQWIQLGDDMVLIGAPS